MKFFCGILFLLLPFVSGAQDSSFSLRGHRFLLQRITLAADDGESDSVLRLYRADSSKQQLIIQHTLNGNRGDCNSRSLELGTYRFTDTTIVFYSYWAHWGDSPTWPCGVRKQEYVFGADGRLRPLSAAIGIEPGTASDEMALYNTSDGKKTLSSIIREKYHARSVSGNEKAALEKEAREVLAKRIADDTKNWSNPASPFGECH